MSYKSIRPDYASSRTLMIVTETFIIVNDTARMCLPKVTYVHPVLLCRLIVKQSKGKDILFLVERSIFVACMLLN